MADTRLSFFIAGTSFAAPPLAPGLHVVSTPIGNLRDITLRALETLAAADIVFCEDTRHSATLLDHYGIRTPRRSLHEHNERERIDEVLARIGEGRAVALISDAGTPLLSDPGFPLVRAVREAGLPVTAAPGASALLAGLAIAGLPTDSFSFLGFLPSKAGQRANALAALRDRSDTLVFYESPRRLGDTLAAMVEAFGATRPAVVALELTKRFERSERGALGELAAHFAEGDTRGEAVIIVGGAEAPIVDAADWQAALVAELTTQALRTAVDAVAARFGLKRKEVYDTALALKKNGWVRTSRPIVAYTDAPSVELDRRVVHFDRRRDPPRANLTAIDTERLGLKLGGQYRCRATLVYGDGIEVAVETTMAIHEFDTAPGVPQRSISLAISPLLDAGDDFERLVLSDFAPDGISDEK